MIEAGTPPIPRSIVHYGDDAVPVNLKPAAGVEALYAPRRTVLDPILVDAAEEAGAEFCFGVSMSDLLRDEADVLWESKVATSPEGNSRRDRR